MSFLKSATLVAAAATLGLSGCMVNPNTGERTASKTAVYGAGAAITCGIIGAISHGSKGARNSAAACGAIGAGVGAYMDYQESKLRESLANTGVEVQRSGNEIKLTMPESVTFPINRYELTPQAQMSLDKAAQTLTTYNETNLTIVGHADSSGNDSINVPLSHNRAQAVANYLNQRGVAAGRLSVAGRGSSQPIASNTTPEGRAQNRRVEILINPNQAAARAAGA